MARPGIAEIPRGNAGLAVFDQAVTNPVVADAQERRYGKALTAVVISTLGVAACSGGANVVKHIGESGSSTSSELAAACGDLVLGHSANDTARYRAGAFLPESDKIGTKKGTQPYVESLYGENGPLGGKSDTGVEALITGLITDRANNASNVADGKYSVHEHFQTALDRYNSPTGLAAAEQDCNDGHKVIVQLAGFTDNFAQKGENLKQLIPVLDAQGNIVDYTEKSFQVSTGTLIGIEITNRKTAKNVAAGVPDMLFTPEGFIITKGDDKSESKPTPTPTPSSGDSKESKDQGNNSNQNNAKSGGSSSNNSNQKAAQIGKTQDHHNKNGGGTSGTGDHNGVAKGDNPEKNQNGPNTGPGTGGPGSTPEATTGNDNTPNTGGGSGSGSGGSGGGTPTSEATPTPTPTSSSTPTPVVTPTPTPTPTKSAHDCDINAGEQC